MVTGLNEGATQRVDRALDAGLAVLNDREFERFRRLIYDVAGISLAPSKKALVAGRLAKRLRAYGMRSYGEYLALIEDRRRADERQVAVDLLTTNETHFFREPKHFDFLLDRVLAEKRPGTGFRVWSAASSSGEEAYTLAMLLGDCLGDGPWEIVGSDICTRVLEKARQGVYPMDRAREIPERYLRRFCLKGTGTYEGTFAIERRLRERARFLQVNLMEPLPDLGVFDVVFLRNVMIYFDAQTKRKVVERIRPTLRPGGYLIVGHSESLNGVSDAFESVAPSIYRRG